MAISNKLLLGQASIIFGSGEIATAYDVEIQPTGTIVTAPDIEKASAPLAIGVINRGIDISFSVLEATASTLARLVGANQGQVVTDIVRGVTIVRPSNDSPLVDIGSASLAATRLDGKTIRIFIPRAAIVPSLSAMKIGKNNFLSGRLTLRALDPDDGTTVPYVIEVEL